MNRYFAVLLVFVALDLKCQTDNVGAGRAMALDGIDDYIQVGNYKDINLPFTISAWVFFDASGGGPVFSTNDNNPNYRGFWLSVNAGIILCEFGDGTGGNNPAFRKGKQAFLSNVAGRWIHVCAVMTSTSTMSLYVNGIDVGGGPSSGQSGLSMASSVVGDVGKIGYFLSNGVYYHFKGSIDEVRLWNRALSPTEIRDSMCKKLSGNETGLAGYWTFNETSGTTVTDLSAAHQNGTVMGGASGNVYSGAPIGDDSKYQYSTTWTGSTVSFQDGNDLVSASNIVGNPEGLHIYEVKNSPSQSTGLDATASSPPYFGVFVASLDNNNSFDATYSYQGGASCKIFSRADNSVPSWASSTNPYSNVLQRTELLRSTGSGQQINFDLGPDRIVCNQLTTTLLTGVADPSATFLWSTGETTSSIAVSNSSKYAVTVTGTCGSRKDSIQVFFMKTPSFSLGNDVTLCQFSSVILNPISNPSAHIFRWQDGSTGPSFTATNFGKYWVTVSNQCGSTTDSISFTKATSITFDLGLDKVVCDQPSATLSTGITDPKATFKWSSGQTTSSISVSQSGKYSVDVHGPCLTQDTIAIKFVNAPPAISLGTDQSSCKFKPITLSPLANSSAFTYKWQDNSTQPTLAATDFGTYTVTAKNECGSSSASVTFSKYQPSINFVPNVITPNDDSKNQFFKVDDLIKGNVSLLILNQWGKEVYYSPAYQNDWDGGDLSSGVYYMVLSGSCINDFKDWLTIIH